MVCDGLIVPADSKSISCRLAHSRKRQGCDELSTARTVTALSLMLTVKGIWKSNSPSHELWTVIVLSRRC